MENNPEFEHFLLEILSKKKLSQKLSKKITQEIEKQDNILKDVEELLKTNSYENKKKRLKKIYEDEFKTFDKFNIYYRNLLKKSAFISLQQDLIQEIDSDYFQKQQKKETAE